MNTEKRNTAAPAAEIYRERRGYILTNITGGIIGAAAYLVFVGVFLIMTYKAR